MELRRKQLREIRLSDGLPEDNSYPSNHITTGHPSLSLFLSFLLLSPVSSPPSLWLLLISVLALNPFSLHYHACASPLCLYLLYVGIMLVKEGVAGCRRIGVDRQVNNEPALVWNGTAFHSQPNSTLRVGSILLLSDKSKVPADLLLLCSSASDGCCYISTEEILGECNLQVRRAVRDLQRILPREESPQSFNLQKLQMTVNVTLPCSDFYKFEGRLSMKSQPRAAVLDVGNLIARGSVVENTKWVLGLVLYTGMETKIWLDRFPTTRKISLFQKTLSLWTVLIALFVLLLSGLLVLLQYFTSEEEVSGEDFVLYVLCLGTEVPAAMFIGLEIIHSVSLFLFTHDSPHLSFPKGHFPTDLSSPHFLLLDKTGTLTENSLSVEQIIVEDLVYSINQRKLRDEDSLSPVNSLVEEELSIEELQEKMRLGFEPRYRRLCECLVMCNSVIPVDKGAYFSSPSLDEKAIVEAAQTLGCSFITRLDEECGVEMFDTCLTYHILAIRKFNPDLGRVRVLIQGEFDSGATLYVLGSYSVLKTFLSLEKEDRDKLEGRLEGMMKAGLRTVVMGYRRLEGEIVENVRNRAENARISMINVEGKMELILKELEQELSYLGVIGLSDSTLSATHSALASLSSAGLHPWLLSGDTESNTLSCAYSFDLIPTEAAIIHIQGLQSVDMAYQKLWLLTKDWLFYPANVKTVMDSNRESQQNDGFIDARSGREEERSKGFVVSTDGVSLVTVMRDKATRRLFLSLLYGATSVCFHQLLPFHKRELTKVLKKGLYEQPIVVAVGDDGGNVPMILEAQVGIGIAKKKNSRAAARSDVSLKQISELPDLLEKAHLLSFRLTTCALLALYSSSLLLTIKVIYISLSDRTPLGLFSIDTSVLYASLLVLFPILWTVFTPASSLPVSSHLNRYLLCVISLGIGQAVVLVAMIFPAFVNSKGSQGSQLELEIVTLLASLSTILQHILQLHIYLQKSRALLLAIPAISSLGAMLLYYGVREESDGGLEEVFSKAKLVFPLIMGPLACALLSKLTLKLSLFPTNSLASRISPMTPDCSFIQRLRSESPHLMEPYQSSMLRDSLLVQDNIGFELRSFLRFHSKTTERDYQSHYLLNLLPFLRLSLVCFCAEILIVVPNVVIENGTEEPYFLLAVASVAGLFAVSWIEWDVLALARLAACGFLVLLFVLNIVTRSVHCLGYLSVLIGLLVVKEVWVQVVGLTLLTLTLLSINTLIHYISFSTRSSGLEELISAIAPVLILALLSWITLAVTYKSNAHARSEYQLLIETDLRITQNDNILSFLLPDFVRRQVKDGIRYIAQDKDSVTVLFCEICEFDAICAIYGPQELTELLDDIFQKIDELCATFGVAKIETVGKVYLACSGLSDFEADLDPVIQTIPHAQRALELAFGILGAFKRIRLQTGAALMMKIGIHTGPVIAGVVGHHKPQFSLVGDTVNTASRMSTTIDTPNTIQISEATYQSLHPDSLPHEFLRRTINVKGKGELTSYLVTEATHVKIRRTKQSESSTESGTLMRKSRRRSSVIASLRESLELEETLQRNEFALRETVRLFPYFGPTIGNEQRFRNDTLARKLPLMKQGFACYLVGLALLALASFLQAGLDRGNEYFIPASLYCLGFGLSLLLRFSLSSWYINPYFLWFQVLLHFLSCGTLMLSQVLSFPIAVTTLALLADLLLLYQASGLFFRHALVASGVVLVPWVVLAVKQGEWGYGVMGALVGIQQCVGMYYKEKNQRTFFSLSAHANREIANTERLLTQMLPIHAYESLKHQDWVTDRLLNVTLLYADISGFTAWASKRSPQEVITRLGQIYTQLDQICHKLKLYKVHTIGDCYVSMSATSNSPKRDAGLEAYKMVCFAVEMTAVLEADEELKMRVGVHTGEVVAGITGSKVVRYDIYGKDVLVANKMESNGQPGKINVSEQVKSLLEATHPDEFSFEAHKTVDIAEVGVSVQCYLLSKNDEKSRCLPSSIVA